MIQSSIKKSELLVPVQMERSLSQDKSDEQVILEALALAQSRKKSFAAEPNVELKPEITRRRSPLVRSDSQGSKVSIKKMISKQEVDDEKLIGITAPDALNPVNVDNSINGPLFSFNEKSNNTAETSMIECSSGLPTPNIPILILDGAPTVEKPSFVTERSILQSAPNNPTTNSTKSRISHSSSITSERVAPKSRIAMQIELPKSIAPFQLQQGSNNTAVVVNMPAPTFQPHPPTQSPAPTPVPLSRPVERKSNQNLGQVRGWKRFFDSKVFRQPDMSSSSGVSMSMLRLSGDNSEALFHPQSIAIKLWNSAYFCFQIIIVLLLPACIVLEDTLGYSLYGITICNSVFLALDTLIKINTGIMSNQQVQMDAIKKHYFKGGSWIFDLITFIPWIYVIDAVAPPPSLNRSPLRVVCMLNATGIVSLLLRKGNLGYLSEIVTYWARKNSVSSSLIDSVKVMVLMCFYWHLNACFTMILRKNEISFTLAKYKSEWEHYSAAVFEAASEMLANGYCLLI
jgi:hypothetical protein